MHASGILAFFLAFLASFSLAKVMPDYTLHLGGDCCRIWSRSRGCIEGMWAKGPLDTSVACYPYQRSLAFARHLLTLLPTPIALGLQATWSPSGPDAVNPKCQIWNIPARKCEEWTDGREDGWNPNPQDAMERSMRGKTVTMKYEHNAATFYPTDMATTITEATDVVVRTTVTGQTTTSSPLPTRYETVTVPPTSAPSTGLRTVLVPVSQVGA
ncbi:hypothetical protein B0A55_03100 [Friedmanniomyces simplex]|uniref:Uncharacterized protein n=1 Tax=Friedmanniomyces simplex TaxID=329884 RepID=A0A4U0XIG3_9PEZI|nr:hypothetical protein B0A55_03100 [Friedmanniomyces simplex]